MHRAGERRRVVAAFDGGSVSSDAGALLLGWTDEAIGLIVSCCEKNAVDYVFGLAARKLDSFAFICGRMRRQNVVDPGNPSGVRNFPIELIS